MCTEAIRPAGFGASAPLVAATATRLRPGRRAGATFIKIGVGVLRKPDERKYDPYRLYPIVDAGTWTVNRRPGAVEFTHALADASSGYAYEYRKTVSVIGDSIALSAQGFITATIESHGMDLVVYDAVEGRRMVSGRAERPSGLV